MRELYGWKGFLRLAGLFTFQGLVLVALGVALVASDAPPRPTVLAGGVGLAVLVGALWHHLLPTLFRFDLVFLPALERRLLLPTALVAAVCAAVIALGEAASATVATKVLGAGLVGLGALSFGVAGVLGVLLRDELRALRAMRDYLDRFAEGRDPSDVARLRLFLAQREACASPGVPIRGLEFPGLSSRPWHDPASFPWVRVLEDNFEVIREEVLAALGRGESLKQYRYPGLSTSKWQSLMLYEDRRGASVESWAKLPKTLALFRSLPIVPMREVMVSVLRGRSTIPPHRDSGNLGLTCQLAVEIPDGCGIRVGLERRAWTPGRCIVFDTSYEHEVWNDSDQDRVVFLFDFLHPDLTETELDFFERWFALASDRSHEAVRPRADRG